MSKTVLIIAIVLIAIVGGYFLFRGGYQAPETAQPQQQPELGVPAPGQESVPEMIVVPQAEVTELTVSGTEYSFGPASITVQEGDQVRITFRNDGSISHNFIIEGLGVGTRTIGAGQTDTVEFTAPASGTYTIFCSVPGHRAIGMEGNLNVE